MQLGDFLSTPLPVFSLFPCGLGGAEPAVGAVGSSAAPRNACVHPSGSFMAARLAFPCFAYSAGTKLAVALKLSVVECPFLLDHTQAVLTSQASSKSLHKLLWPKTSVPHVQLLKQRASTLCWDCC